MSSETKYLVMSELIGVPAAAIEKAEEQASRIIGIVKGGCTCSIPVSQETLTALDKLLDPAGDYTASFHPESTEYKPLPPYQDRHPEFRPKHTTKPTKESLKLTEKIVALRGKE